MVIGKHEMNIFVVHTTLGSDSFYAISKRFDDEQKFDELKKYQNIN